MRRLSCRCPNPEMPLTWARAIWRKWMVGRTLSLLRLNFLPKSRGNFLFLPIWFDDRNRGDESSGRKCVGPDLNTALLQRGAKTFLHVWIPTYPPHNKHSPSALAEHVLLNLARFFCSTLHFNPPWGPSCFKILYLALRLSSILEDRRLLRVMLTFLLE